MSADSVVKIASAGSTVFGARAAGQLFKPAFGSCLVSVTTDHGHLLQQQALAGGLEADIVILPADMIAQLEAAGITVAEGRFALGSVNIGAAVKAGAAKVDVSSRAQLADALQQADEILLTLAPTGEHLMQVIAGLGLQENLSAKIRRFDKSVEVNAYTAAAHTSVLAFGPATEILAWHDKGVTWCGPVAAEFQIVLPYAAATLATAGNMTAAQAFLDFLASDKARCAFAATGVTAP